jgi:hypothetical protein
MLNRFRVVKSAGALLAVWLTVSLVGCASAPKVPAEFRMDTYDDAPYAAVLDAVVEKGMVDYHAFNELPPPKQRTAADYDTLDGKLDLYLDAVARFGPESTPALFPDEDAELAYYLNAYNALMIRLWLDSGGRSADADDKVQWLTWFTINQWKVDQRTMSLDYLEQRLIRPRFEEARIHAALVCGAVDCPPLRDEPFVGDRLDEQLDDQMRQWLHAPARDGLRIADDGRVYLSAILGWYRSDFRETGGLDAMVETYLDDDDPRKAKALEALRNNKAKFMGYDWTINLPENAPAPGSDADAG